MARIPETTDTDRAVILKVDVRARNLRYSGCNENFRELPIGSGVPAGTDAGVTAAGEQAISRRFATNRLRSLPPMVQSRARLTLRAAAALSLFLSLLMPLSAA